MKSFSATTEKGMDVTIMADYIDKEAALSLVQPDAPEDEKAAITIATAKKLVRSIIQRAPAADVAPVRHGRWVHTDLASHWHGKDECSECTYHEQDRSDLSRFRYCPNCGAKMDLDALQ